MLFPTFTFAVFFAAVLPLSWALRGRATAWKVLILTASAVFYGYWDWRFLGRSDISGPQNLRDRDAAQYRCR